MLRLAALLLAGAQPGAAEAPTTAPPVIAADSDSIFGIFESVCLAKGETPSGFEPATWSDFPPPLRLMNTYNHDGTFLRRADPAAYIVRVEGPAHMLPGIEKKCSVAARGIDTAGIVERLKKRAQAKETSDISASGASMILIAGRGGIFSVIRVEDGWIIVRSEEILIRADSVPRRYRPRKAKRD